MSVAVNGRRSTRMAPPELNPDALSRRARTAVPKRRGELVRSALTLADLAGLGLAFAAVQLIMPSGGSPTNALEGAAETLLFLATLPAWLVVAKLYGLYEHDEERTDHSSVDEVMGVFHLLSTGSWLLLAAAWLSGIASPALPKLALFWAFAIIAVPVARATARAICRRHIAYMQNAVIVGAGGVGQLIAKKLRQHPEYGINLVGFVDAAPRERASGIPDAPLLGDPTRLPTIVRRFGVQRVILAFSNESDLETLGIVRALDGLDVQVDVVPRLFEIVDRDAEIYTIEGVALVGIAPPRLSRSARLGKRAFDALLSALGLLVLAVALCRGRPPHPDGFARTDLLPSDADGTR